MSTTPKKRFDAVTRAVFTQRDIQALKRVTRSQEFYLDLQLKKLTEEQFQQYIAKTEKKTSPSTTAVQ